MKSSRSLPVHLLLLLSILISLWELLRLPIGQKKQVTA
jgi:hypothetical protein